MRVTINLPEALHTALSTLSKQRGASYERLITEAIESYLRDAEASESSLDQLRRMCGSWTAAEAECTRLRIAAIRANHITRTKP